MYTNGKGVSKDAKQAVYWYKKAAEQGYAGAQYNLGVIIKNRVCITLKLTPYFLSLFF
jgi:TPR repeat protein